MHHTAKARTTVPKANVTPHSHVLLNRVIPLVLRSPLHGLLSKNLMLLTYTGRKSGTRYTIPVTYLEGEDGTIRVFSNQRWWRNLRPAAPVTLRLRGHEVQAAATVVEDRATVTREVAAFLARKGAKAAPMINVPIPASRPSTEADIARASREHVVVYCETQPSSVLAV